MSGTTSNPSDAEILTIDYSRNTQGPPGRGYLLVIEEGSSSVFHLPQRGEVVIGRSPEAQLRVRDTTASRKHARLKISGAEILVSDLGSHNGTRVNGELLRGPRQLSSSDVISICDVTLVLVREGGVVSLRPLGDVFALRQRLDEELARALTFGRQLALCSIELGAGATAQQAVGALSGKLRIIDLAACGRKGEILLLFPEQGREEAEGSLASVLEPLAQVAPSSRCGLAVCPEDGADADILLGAARAACAAAGTGQVKAAQDLPTTLQVGATSIVVADEVMVRLYELIRRLANSTLPVLVCGETGTGKELAAAALHEFSPRKDERLVVLNCAALPETLAESELFGHEKGAFSGADRSKAGLFESASKGTLFLDELGELSLPVQAKLLRALEQRTIIRLGSTEERPVDVRVIAATNRDLEAEVKAGRFRQDLYFRLSTATIMLPPLRDRRRELPILARTFLAHSCQQARREPMTISTDAMHDLLSHSWPGNLRELRNVMDYVAATVTEPFLLSCHLPFRLTGSQELNEGETAPAEEGARKFRPLEEELRDIERTRMIEALQAAEGFQNRAAELLSMPLRTFAHKVKLYGLSKRQPRSTS